MGTTSVLVASSLALLIVVSALVAFNGWPDAGIADRVESTEISGGDPVFEVSGPAIVAADGGEARAGAPRGNAPPNGPGGGTPPGLTEGPGDTPSAAPAPGLLERLTQPPQTGEVTTGVAEGTQEFTGSLGRSVSTVSPELGRFVSETGKVLSDVVRSVPNVDSGKLGG